LEIANNDLADKKKKQSTAIKLKDPEKRDDVEQKVKDAEKEKKDAEDNVKAVKSTRF